MGWLNLLQNKTIGLDTSPLIYFIEQNTKYLPLIKPFFQGINNGDFHVITSTLTITEVLVHPLRWGASQFCN